MTLNSGVAVVLYQGRDEKGAGVFGRKTFGPDELAEWVRRRFQRGWQSLTVTRAGEEVAGIVRNWRLPPMWWSE